MYLSVNPFTKTEVDPSFSKEERFLNETLQRAMAPQQWVPPSSQGILPERFGYDRSEPGWETIMMLDRNFNNDRRMDYSGVRGGYEGTARPAIGYV